MRADTSEFYSVDERDVLLVLPDDPAGSLSGTWAEVEYMRTFVCLGSNPLFFLFLPWLSGVGS